MLEALKNQMIMPCKYNIMHFLAYQNKIKSVDKAFDNKTPSKASLFNATPLTIAIIRNSNSVVTGIINRAIQFKEIHQSISAFELCEVIRFSPENLREFFVKSEEIIDNKDVPRHGIIKDD